MVQRDVPHDAAVVVPAWFSGSPLATLLGDAGLRGTAVDSAAGRWRIRTDERHTRTGPDLVTVTDLAGPAQPHPRFDLLGGDSSTTSVEVLTAAGGLDPRHAHRLADVAEQSGQLVDLVTAALLRLSVATTAGLATTAESAYVAVRQVEGDHGLADAPFDHAGVHLIRARPQLHGRIGLIAVLLRLAHDPQVAAGQMDQAQAAAERGEFVFAASRQLSGGIYPLDAYLGPLVGTLTPFVWAFPAYRADGALVYSLGQPVTGIRTEMSAELLQVLAYQEGLEEGTAPRLTPGACSAAVRWWVERLNALFGVLTDPGVFTDHGGRYQPDKHLRSVLNLEQLFRRVTAIQTSHRDATARRVLLFSVLDTLEPLTGRSLEQACTLSIARRTLADLRSGPDALPGPAAEVLLSAADRVVQALHDVQGGFFIRNQRGTADLELLGPSGRTERITPERAAALYLKLLRDATHGHGGKTARQKQISAGLLAHHDGTVPPALPLLGYLYLLRLLAGSDADLRRRLYAGGSQ